MTRFSSRPLVIAALALAPTPALAATYTTRTFGDLPAPAYLIEGVSGSLATGRFEPGSTNVHIALGESRASSTGNVYQYIDFPHHGTTSAPILLPIKRVINSTPPLTRYDGQGVFVATADLNNDGHDELITSSPSHARVRVFGGDDYALLSDFTVNQDPIGAHVASGLYPLALPGTPNRTPSLVVGLADGSVRFVSPSTGQTLRTLRTSNTSSFGPTPVAQAPLTGIDATSLPDVLVTSYDLSSHTSHVHVFAGGQIEIESFSWGVSQPGLHIGSIAVADLLGDATPEVIIGAAEGDLPLFQIYSPRGQLLHSQLAFDPSFRGGVSVAAADFDHPSGKQTLILSAAVPEPTSLALLLPTALLLKRRR